MQTGLHIANVPHQPNMWSRDYITDRMVRVYNNVQNGCISYHTTPLLLYVFNAVACLISPPLMYASLVIRTPLAEGVLGDLR